MNYTKGQIMNENVEIIFVLKNNKHAEEFLGQLYDGWGENYISIEILPDEPDREVYYIEMLENEFFHEKWHLQYYQHGGFEWEDILIEFDTRHDAIMYYLGRDDSNKYRIKEDNHE